MSMESAAKRPKLEPKDEDKVTVIKDEEGDTNCTYKLQRALGKGAFGVVWQAEVMETGELVALKSMRPNENSKDREIQILKELTGCPNIIQLKGAFMSVEQTSPTENENRMNLVMEFMPDTLHRVIKHYNSLNSAMGIDYVKLYFYQLLRAISVIHCRGIVHCDIKPQNLLIEGKSQTVKLCDFGTAKRIAYDEKSRPYACSRYYRAPELVLGATDYTPSVDLWSAGCVFAEMIIGQPLFTGKDGINQLLQMIKVLGTPSWYDLKAMNPNYGDSEFKPRVAPLAWSEVLRGWAPREANDLADQLVRYDPTSRTPALHAMMHHFFDGLRAKERPEFAHLFTFTQQDLIWLTQYERDWLIPKWCR